MKNALNSTEGQLPKKNNSKSWGCHRNNALIQVKFVYLCMYMCMYVFIFVCNFYTQCGTQTPDSEIKSHMFYPLSQPGAAKLILKA